MTCPTVLAHGWPQVGEMLVSPAGYRARVLELAGDADRVDTVIGRLFEAPDHILVIVPVYNPSGVMQAAHEYIYRRH